MPDDIEVRDNFKTIRLSDSEYALIIEAASLMRQANPSKVIRDGAVARAREIVESASPTDEEKLEALRRRMAQRVTDS